MTPDPPRQARVRSFRESIGLYADPTGTPAAPHVGLTVEATYASLFHDGVVHEFGGGAGIVFGV